MSPSTPPTSGYRIAPWILLAVATLLATMWYLSAVFVPLGLGLTLAFVLAPAVDKLAGPTGSRARAAGLLIGSFFMTLLVLGAVAVPMLVQEAHHWAASVSGEGNAEIAKTLDTTLDYGAWTDPDAEVWTAAQVADGAEKKGAPAAVVRALRAAAPSESPGPRGEIPLADALGDRDGDGRLDPGYAKRFRRLTKDKSSWLGGAAQWFDRSGASRELGRLSRSSNLSDRLQKLLSGDALSTAGDVGLRILGTVGSAVSRALQLLIAALLIPFYAFVFLLQLPRWRKTAPRYLPAATRPRWLAIGHRIGTAIAGFVRGRLVVCSIVGLLTAIGWAALGVRLGLLMGLAVGALTIVPVVNLIAFVPVLLMSLLEVATGSHGWGWFAGVIAVYAVGQIAESVLNPIIVGDAVQLDMVTIIVSFFIGGAVAGMFGLIVAVPVAATLRILAEELLLPRWRAWAAGPDAFDAAAEDPTVTRPSDTQDRAH